MSVHHKYTKDFKEKIENLIKFNTILTEKTKHLFDKNYCSLYNYSL